MTEATTGQEFPETEQENERIDSRMTAKQRHASSVLFAFRQHDQTTQHSLHTTVILLEESALGSSTFTTLSA